MWEDRTRELVESRIRLGDVSRDFELLPAHELVRRIGRESQIRGGIEERREREKYQGLKVEAGQGEDDIAKQTLQPQQKTYRAIVDWHAKYGGRSGMKKALELVEQMEADGLQTSVILENVAWAAIFRKVAYHNQRRYEPQVALDVLKKLYEDGRRPLRHSAVQSKTTGIGEKKQHARLEDRFLGQLVVDPMKNREVLLETLRVLTEHDNVVGEAAVEALSSILTYAMSSSDEELKEAAFEWMSASVQRDQAIDPNVYATTQQHVWKCLENAGQRAIRGGDAAGTLCVLEQLQRTGWLEQRENQHGNQTVSALLNHLMRTDCPREQRALMIPALKWARDAGVSLDYGTSSALMDEAAANNDPALGGVLWDWIVRGEGGSRRVFGEPLLSGEDMDETLALVSLLDRQPTPVAPCALDGSAALLSLAQAPWNARLQLTAHDPASQIDPGRLFMEMAEMEAAGAEVSFGTLQYIARHLFAKSDTDEALDAGFDR